MKKALSLLLLCFAVFGVARAQETLTVYDGEATSGYVPIYGFYADAFNKCEMIMPSDNLSELQGATLTKLTWYLSTPASDSWGDANYQVYLKEVSESALGTDFLGVEDATLVFEGSLDGTGSTLDIAFASNYLYGGGNLLIAVYQTVTGTYKSASFAGTEVSGASISAYSYSSFDAITTGTARNFLPKTTFEFIPSSGTVYYKPKNLTVNNITTTSATLNWEAGADEIEWEVEYKAASADTWVNEGLIDAINYILVDLTPGVKYDVHVRSVYADNGQSGWTQTSFATEACEDSDKGEVAYTLTDTYGDGWNGGAKLQVFLSGTDIWIADILLPQGSGNSLLEGSLMLCYDVDYDLVWVAGSYNYEDGFVLTAPSGETIYEFQGTGSSSGPVPNPGILTTFKITRATCMRPTDVAASDVVYNGATLTWTPGAAEQDLWEVIYAAGEVAAADITMIPIEVSEPMYTLTGLAENTTYSAYVRAKCSDTDQSIWSNVCTFTTPLQFPIPTGLAVSDITANSAKATWTGEAETYNFRYREKSGLDESFEDENTTMQSVDNDGDGNEWQILKITAWTMGGTPLTAAEGDYCIISESRTISDDSYVTGDNWLISNKVNLGGTLQVSAADLGADYGESFSVMLSTTGTALDDFTELGSESIASDLNVWNKFEYDLSAYAGQQGYVAIRHQPNGSTGFILLIDAIKITGVDSSVEWITMEGVTSPAVMDGLTPETTYETQVQAIYPDGVSAWTDLVYFTTLAADAMPNSVTVDNITATTADVVVVGSQETYNIRYRKAATGFLEDFEGIAANGDSAPDGWTTIDADGDGYEWFAWFPSQIGADETDNQGNPTVLDHVCMTSASWYSQTVLYPDDWLITPQVSLGGTLSLWARGQDPSYAGEHFAVYVSTTGTAVADFVELIPETVAQSVYTEYTADLSSYAGKKGYIAIRHFNISDMFRLNIDNVAIIQEGQEAGEWVTIENVTVPYTITGLDPETKYEVQVQGVMADLTTTDWTDILSFTTLQGFFKHIVGYGTSDEGYYFIASPVDNVDPATVPNLIGEHYDLYAFDESQEHEEWRNYKVNPSTFRLTSGVGYLYANKEDVDLVFSGTPATGTSFNVTLAKTANVMMEGWNLVGNPFGVEAYIDRAFYIMEGNGYVAKTANDAVEIMQGVLVSAESDGETMAFSTEKSTTKSANVALNLTRENSLVDRAIVSFGEGHNLGKLSFRESSSKIYMPVNGKDYAVVYAEEMGEMPVDFKAEHSGTYTIGVNTENVELGYLHLIDNMTGNDVDLLANPSYTFDAKATDYASRFKLVFATGNNEQFAFIGNGEIILNGINGNTTVQLFDVTGRMLSSTNGATRISTESMAAGVYMLRLVNGNDVKTQKIVVK